MSARDPALDAIARRAKRARRLPPDAVCSVCGGTEHLVRVGDVTRCYEHRCAETAVSELDHPADQANLPRFVVPLAGNDHRRVTDLRSDLGKDDWPIAGGDPVLVAAHALAGFASLLWLVAEWLVELAGWLVERLGEGWWHDGPRPPFAP